MRKWIQTKKTNWNWLHENWINNSS
jgi:hypothetical protein